MKAIKTIVSIVVATLIVTTIFACFVLNEVNAPSCSQIFRPLYPGYQYSIDGMNNIQKNLTAINREWNFEGWDVQKLTMNIEWSSKKSGLGKTADITLYLSKDGGNSYPTAINLENQIIDYHVEQPVGYYSGVATYDLTSYSDRFSPLSRLIIQIDSEDLDSYISIVYWGNGQQPVPPFDYVDQSGNYIQYCISFDVNYREQKISFRGTAPNFDVTGLNISKIQTTANMIVKTIHPSGAGNEVVGKQFGTDSWIVTYSTELGMISLVDASNVLSTENYLLTVKRHIPWLFSKQNSDGSFYFTLTDGDQHVWTNSSSDNWSGYDKIDSFSALSITLMRRYYDATGDLDFLNKYFPNVVLSKNFLTDLIDSKNWIPVDGYHYNNITKYSKSTISQLHDSAEVYQALKDYAYLEGVLRNTQEQTYWEIYATAVANGIRTLFWNETLQKYSNAYDIASAKQQMTSGYSQIVPVLYNIESNATKAALTVQSYVQSHVDRRFNIQLQEETVTTNSMLYLTLTKLVINFNMTEPWIQESIKNTSEWLSDDGNRISEFQFVETSAWELQAFLAF